MLQAPISDSGKVLCVGLNYVDHCTEQGLPIPTVRAVCPTPAHCLYMY